MEIIVCVKRVPEAAEADIVIDSGGKNIDSRDLAFVINEWDNYAVEEAVRLVEQLGGSVTVVSIGPKRCDEVLRRCLAMGADRAIRLTDDALADSDARATARALGRIIKDLPFDLVFTGVQAADDGQAQVGVMLAGMLSVPHATVVTEIVVDGESVRIVRELEDGLGERLELKLPAVLTIQTGINEPRYVSIMGIRKAMKKELAVANLSEINLAGEQLGPAGSLTSVKRMFIPTVEQKAEILTGSVDESCAALADRLKKGGLV